MRPRPYQTYRSPTLPHPLYSLLLLFTLSSLFNSTTCTAFPTLTFSALTPIFNAAIFSLCAASARITASVVACDGFCRLHASETWKPALNDGCPTASNVRFVSCRSRSNYNRTISTDRRQGSGGLGGYTRLYLARPP